MGARGGTCPAARAWRSASSSAPGGRPPGAVAVPRRRDSAGPGGKPPDLPKPLAAGLRAFGTTCREGSKLQAQQHAMVAEGVGLHPVEVKELGHAFVIGAEQLG